jgi:hypothetical protein
LPIAFFGLLSTTLLVTSNVTTSYLEVYAFVVQRLLHGGGEDVNKKNIEANPEYMSNATTTLVGNSWSRAYYWIPKYVFDKEVEIILLPFSGLSSQPPTIHTDKILLKLDNHILNSLHNNVNQDNEYLKWIRTVNSSTYKIAVFEEKSPILKGHESYPYSGSMNHNVGIATTEFRTN